MKRLIAGNWKMNLGPAEASLMLQRLEKHIKTSAHVEVVLCVPFVDLYPLRHEIDRHRFKLGAQNIHGADSGAFTGEISGPMLKGLVDYVIVGHSERRHGMGETDKMVADKLAAAVRNGITPIFCVGETLEDRHHGYSVQVVTDQLTAGLAHLTADEIDQLVIAYEPVWAIGTGEFAKPDDVAPVVSAIRRCIEDLYGEGATANLRVLYGGSVKPDNAASYLALDGVEGLLVGGASLNYAEFSDIVTRAHPQV